MSASGSNYFSASPNPGAYSPSINAGSPRPGGRGGAVTGAGAKRGSVQNSPAPGSPQVLPDAYSSISATAASGTSTFPAASTSTFATTSYSSVLPQGGITATPRPAAGVSTGYSYSTTPSPYASLTSMAAGSSHFPTAAQTFNSAYPSAYSSTPYTPYGSSTPSLNTSGLISLSGAPVVPAGVTPQLRASVGVGSGGGTAAGDEDGEGDDELFPAMADDDYSAQLSWNSQSKDNLKVLMDNFTPAQYERFEAYRRGALPKQAVRKVVQQILSMQVSPPVAQVVAGFSKVFVGEIVEKARAVQARRGETGPLAPDHLREAYRMYQEETGHIGAARPLKSKKIVSDIFFLIVPSLSLQDVVSLSMVNKSLYGLSEEHSYWLEPLRTARILHPIPCATFDDLTARTTKNLKQLALHTIRLARAWRQPLPQISGPIQTFRCGAHNNILYCLPGTDAIVLYSFALGTVICVDVKTGASSTPVFVGHRIFDISSPLEEPTRFSVGVLVEERAGTMSIVVLRAANQPLTADIVLRHELDPGYTYTGIFMTSSVVGVARAQRGGIIEVLSFNLANPKISTLILTDRPRTPVLGSTVVGETVFFIVPQGTDAFVYVCPPRLLANFMPSPETDYSIQRSHVARIPRPPDFELQLPSPSDLSPRRPITRLDYCVLSTEPNHGRNTISVARNVTTSASGAQIPHSLEITFWPRPASAPVLSSSAGSQANWEKERADARRMQPSQTIWIPGSLSNQPGTAWELLVIANSGLAVVLVIDPPPDPDVAADAPAPPPKLMMARYDPALHTVSLHELCIPAGTGDPEPNSDLHLDTRGIYALAFDDHRGYVIVVTVHSVLHYIPYA
ncbi:F-box domain-containing protein [Mycena sanguinolenta]|uniref:Transcription initiation factor TFIID subunit 11 n=1 Tax=Mycena sanguinolenta TaxID=230812 RepID=A0A8H6Z9G5_9AGAR|nr:F-box domain-containing protein [Mycena sanguinolenta]